MSLLSVTKRCLLQKAEHDNPYKHDCFKKLQCYTAQTQTQHKGFIHELFLMEKSVHVLLKGQQIKQHI